MIKELPKNRLNKESEFGKTKDNKSPSAFAAFISDKQLNEISNKEENKSYKKISRLSLFSTEALRQAIAHYNIPKRNIISIGCMSESDDTRFFKLQEIIKEKIYSKGNFEHNVYNEVYEKRIRNYFEEKIKKKEDVSKYVSSLKKEIKKLIPKSQEIFFVDAACASSIAAIDIAIQKLQGYETDFALAGGIEASLSLGSCLHFAKLGALSKDFCYPLDLRAKGVVQGEGAVFFGLMRLEDAILEKKEILGVIESCFGSNDGKKGSLVSPTLEGQVENYKQTYTKETKDKLNYIECHATGTKTGDSVEIKSIDSFFNKEIPIGSIKEQIGHTKGAAGATSLLKLLLMIQEKQVFASKIFKKPLIKSKCFVSKKKIKLSNEVFLGLNSFGFGGQNYHLIISNRTKEISKNKDKKIESTHVKKKTMKQPEETIVIIGEAHKTKKNISKINFQNLCIQPNAINQIDHFQQQTAECVYDILGKLDIQNINHKKISVFSASMIGSLCEEKIEQKILLSDLITYIHQTQENNKKISKTYIEKLSDLQKKLPEINQNSSAGSLNSVVAGRTCSIFDFQGNSFNIDSENTTFQAAISLAKTQLISKRSKIIFLSHLKETIQKKGARKRGECICLALSTETFAQKNNFEILGEVEIQYE